MRWYIVRLKFRIQGHLFPNHWITKANIVIYYVLQKPLANLHMLALNSVVAPTVTRLRKSFFEISCSGHVSVCVTYEKTKRKFPWHCHVVCIEKTKYTNLRGWFCQKFIFLLAKCLQLSTNWQILSNILGTSHDLRLGNVGANSFINVKSHGSVRKGHGN